MKHIITTILISLSFSGLAQYEGNTTPTYHDLIEAYELLAKEHDEITFFNMGSSDYGLPIYLCVISDESDSLKVFEKARNSTTVLINNAIHPGEPDGVNACLIWIQNWINTGKSLKGMPTIAIIPAYNVGGMMNRSGTSRANQDGPEEYGFRGNAQNLDLNRDCIKADSKNMFTFAKIFHALDPDVFLDTHVSNGADYQYTMTYIASLRERMAPDLGDLTYEELIPYLHKRSSRRGYDLVPYVHLKGETPEEGIAVFDDLPRYIMGYASLFNSISFTLETHMLKSFPERVKSTLVFIDETLQWTGKNSAKVESARKKAFAYDRDQVYFKLNYELQDKKDSILFKGFEASHPISEVSGEKRLKYHRDQPYEKYIPFFRYSKGADSVVIPEYYVVGGECDEVIERLRSNQVEMLIANEIEDSLMTLHILNFKSPKQPYEGHFLHSKVEIGSYPQKYDPKPGDVIVRTDQRNRRFILSVLEPQAPDSYFAWNFFDSYVQQKEYFSPYVFEDKAAKILAENPELRDRLEKRKTEDPEFASSSWQQLYFVYRNSEFFEPSFHRLPIYKYLR